MTTRPVVASPTGAGFNDSLRDGAGKSTPAPTNHRPAAPTFTVVLDAGHGGKDPGGMGANSQEKHIALNITRYLAIGIRTNYPDVNVVLTRNDDTFIPLHERAQVANDEGADLFVSIHANIMPGSSATYGTETFVMGQHVAERNLAVAKRENAAILLEDNVEANYGYDPNSDEGHIMMSTFQHAFLDRSIRFADMVEGQFAKAGRKSRGVKQAGFAVLKNTTMPAVLVECGFMSNPDEEAYLLSERGQQVLAGALLSAFQQYYWEMTGKSGGTVVCALPPTVNTYTRQAAKNGQPFPSPKAVNPPAATPKHEYFLNPQWSAKGGTVLKTVPRPVASELPVAPAPVAYRTTVYQPSAYVPQATAKGGAFSDLISKEVTNAVLPAVYRSGPAAPVLDTVPGGYRFAQARARREAPRRATDFSTVLDSQLKYAIQLGAIKKDLPVTDPAWAAVPYPITKFREGGLNKYQVQGLRTGKATREALETIKKNGFRGAMVVIYYQGKRVAPGTVKYLLNR